MPKVTEAHRANRRDQILDAALDCFAAQGFQATTMADIIAASGLSAGAIYGYFTGKRELGVAAARRGIAGRVSDIDRAAVAGPLSAAAMLRAVSDGFDRDRISVGLIVQLWGEAVSDPEFHEIATGAFGELGATFVRNLTVWAVANRGMNDAEAGAWATESLPILLALGQGLILQRALLPRFDRERYLAGVERLFG